MILSAGCFVVSALLLCAINLMSAPSDNAIDDHWKLLSNHIGACKADGCSCRLFLKRFDDWSKRLPLVVSAKSDESWLYFHFNRHAQFRWMCLACHGDMHLNDSLVDAAPGEAQHIQIGHLLVHHNSTSHQENVAKMLGAQVGHSVVPEYTTPPKQLFKDLFESFQSGGTPTKGFILPSGRVAFVKANRMLWCIDQALCDIRRHHLSHSETINIIRNERHSRMHARVRMSAEGDEPADDNPYVGYLGQSRGHRQDSIGITEGTVQIVRNACTSRANAPEGADVEPQFHSSAFKHACHAVEALSIDSAENEVCSGRDMSQPKTGGREADFPNCHHTLRDSAHCARRLLTRLFKACTKLDYVSQFFMVLCSIIQWSDDMRTMYGECTSASIDAAVSSAFSHMRAAKHRIESALTPLSRCCLDPSGEHSLMHSFLCMFCFQCWVVWKTMSFKLSAQHPNTC